MVCKAAADVRFRLPENPGIATGWTGVEMSTPLFPEFVPENDADLLKLVYVIWYRISHIIGYSIACFNVSDIEVDKFCVWH